MSYIRLEAEIDANDALSEIVDTVGYGDIIDVLTNSVEEIDIFEYIKSEIDSQALKDTLAERGEDIPVADLSEVSNDDLLNEMVKRSLHAVGTTELALHHIKNSIEEIKQSPTLRIELTEVLIRALLK